jgi:hypothetical protein
MRVRAQEKDLGPRRLVAAAAVVAVVGFGLAGSWHHHDLVAVDGHGLSPAGHASASAPCHVCKLSASGSSLPVPGESIVALAACSGAALPESVVPDRCQRPSTVPARAPPTAAIA